ncbi:MAG: MotA/TolQ/ExbB proton channel family protein [Sedimentisphaerales bacterium]|nr:MotA/TolQ/ExbB proton channel family protein [Sedimentisphaerales bacterium]
MSKIMEHITALWNQAASIWVSGGWGMVALAVNALIMLALGMHVLVKLRQKMYKSVSKETWRHWINHPGERRGTIGKLLDFVTGADSLKQTSIFFEELRSTEIAPFERDLSIMKICVAAAPLLGLLGTVTGMLATFGALASGSGGEKTMGLVAEGISEALITTETGLIIALPGLFFQYQLSRKLEHYKVFLAQLETICTQKLYKKLREGKKDESKSSHGPQIRVYKPHHKNNKATYKPVEQMEKVA